MWVYVLKRKSEVFERFLEWKALVEKSSGHKLKILRTDNGGEYTSSEFQSILKKEGIKHELTVPKTPEQNGVSERMNRTLIEMVRSMMSDARLPQRFWAETLSTAVYLRNRSPTKAVVGLTPFEAWTGEKPKFENLRRFGCAAYAHIAKDERRKLDSKAKKCIFLGYGADTKGYRLYDSERRRAFHSRDVIFNELEDGIQKELEAHTEKHHVDIDWPSDDELAKEVDGRQEINNDEDDVEEPAVNETEPAQPVLRRSTRERRQPDHYGVWVNVADESLKEPVTMIEALASSDKEKWRIAMQKEMKSIQENDVWALVELPKGRKTVGSKWIFKHKLNAEGVVERYKARLVAQGFTQKFGQDYDETFCPVVRFESIRMLIGMAAQHGLKLHQMDVTAAFLNGDLEEEVYMSQPEIFVVKGQEKLVCKLKRSLYGLKQSPRCWNSILDNRLREMGFMQTTGDPCIYTASEGEMVVIAVYVDDIMLAAKSEKRMKEVKEMLAKQFEVKDMGELHHFLGVKVVQDHEKGSVWIGQPAYAESLLEKFGMKDSKPVKTPVSTSSKLVKATDNNEQANQGLYQSAVGSLLYLSTRTRPDIAYAVSNVAKFCSNPSKQHWTAVKRIMRYIKGTIHLGLAYGRNEQKDCIGYSDADWGGDSDDHRSTSGYIFQVGGAAISWRSKKQSCVALSTAEAEYMALTNAAQEAVWLRKLTADLTKEERAPKPIVIYEDNQSAICIAKNPQFHGRTKHIGIKYHYIREQVNSKNVELKYCPTEEMLADMLTKGLNREKLEKLTDMCGMRIINLPASEKEC